MSKINQHIYYNKHFDSINAGFVYEVSLKNLYNADKIYFNIIYSGVTCSLTVIGEKNNRMFDTFLIGFYNSDYLGFIYFTNKCNNKLIKKIYRKVKRHSKNYKLKYKINTVSINEYN